MGFGVLVLAASIVFLVICYDIFVRREGVCPIDFDEFFRSLRNTITDFFDLVLTIGDLMFYQFVHSHQEMLVFIRNLVYEIYIEFVNLFPIWLSWE